MTEHEEHELLKRLILAIENNEGGLGVRLAEAILKIGMPPEPPPNRKIRKGIG